MSASRFGKEGGHAYLMIVVLFIMDALLIVYSRVVILLVMPFNIVYHASLACPQVPNLILEIKEVVAGVARVKTCDLQTMRLF